MKDARVSLVTLGVADLGRSSRFHEALGWRRRRADHRSVVFPQGEGIVLSLFELGELAHNPFFPPDARGHIDLTEFSA